jgi:two-component system KDP operon response regulator KdpE
VVTEAFTVDLAAGRVTGRDGTPIALTPTEWGLLELLARHSGRLVTQRELMQQLWGLGFEKQTHYLRVYVGQLRRKLEPDPTNPRYLLTETGRGYRLDPAGLGATAPT